MTSTVRVDSFLDHLPDGEALPSSIPPVMAQVLDLAKHSGTTLTPRELNEQLAQVLARYDALTASFADNHGRLHEEMAALRQAGGALAGQLQAINADLQRQGNSLSVLAASTSADIQSVQADLQSGLADVQERTTVQLEALGVSLTDDVSRLSNNLRQLKQLLDSQEQIVQEQALRLDQFDVARELLDTAVRGNRKRIDAVREEVDSNHTVVTAQVQGLAALHREHRTEFNALQLLVTELQTEAVQLTQNLQGVNARVSDHVEATRRSFRWIHAGLAGLVLMSLAGLAAVKWLPAFAPEQSALALVQIHGDIERLDAQVAALPTLEFRTATHDNQISQMARTVETLKQGLDQMQQAVRQISARDAAGGVLSPALRDVSWVMQQEPSSFTVQLAGVGNAEEMMRVMQQGLAESLVPVIQPLAYSITHPAEQDRYNLFYGVFASADDARAAISALPASWQANRPWVRQWQAIQEAAR